MFVYMGLQLKVIDMKLQKLSLAIHIYILTIFLFRTLKVHGIKYISTFLTKE